MGLLALSAALFGGFLIYAAYDACDGSFVDLPHRRFFLEDVGAINMAVLVWSLLGVGLLLVAVGILLLTRD